ncbi:MAG: nucleotidyltransferase substrate binding protein [Opitutales bacterium]|nr:nucleotidyltransferase substrate binding protein [Opitutales bacterium]
MEKLATAHKALESLEAVLLEPASILVRDATIQRFEYTSEAVWKAAREWLRQVELIEENHPRGCYRALFRIGRIDETLAAALLESIEDRNRTSHAYIEAVAVAVFERIPQHAANFRRLLESLETGHRPA